MSVLFIISFQAKPEATEAFAKLMENVKGDLPGVPGCIGVKIFREAGVVGAYTLLETWESKAAHLENSKNLVESGAWADIAAMLANDPDGRYFVEI